ncbi:MAG: STAS domain-containing protein [Butyrivibrio sp.]|nr:STAS domain-containing protein [Butyrivibrio sp.]
MLNIEKSMNGNEMVVVLDGRLDTLTSPQLEKAIGEDIEKADSIVLDMGKLEYVSSAGLRVIMAVDIEMLKKNGLVLKDVTQDVKDVLELTGLAEDLKFI